MTHHRVNTPVSRILQLFKDWPIERLAHAEHEDLAGTDDWAIARHQSLALTGFRVGHVSLGSYRGGSACAVATETGRPQMDKDHGVKN
jgi:hypothetical protein